LVICIPVAEGATAVAILDLEEGAAARLITVAAVIDVRRAVELRVADPVGEGHDPLRAHTGAEAILKLTDGAPSRRGGAVAAVEVVLCAVQRGIADRIAELPLRGTAAITCGDLTRSAPAGGRAITTVEFMQCTVERRVADPIAELPLGRAYPVTTDHLTGTASLISVAVPAIELGGLTVKLRVADTVAVKQGVAAAPFAVLDLARLTP
jgi:hypothetical protein